jgi:hypothetical protein
MYRKLPSSFIRNTCRKSLPATSCSSSKTMYSRYRSLALRLKWHRPQNLRPSDSYWRRTWFETWPNAVTDSFKFSILPHHKVFQ